MGDAYGRVVQGAFPVLVKHCYFYNPVYQAPAKFSASFGRFGSGTQIGADRASFAAFLETSSTALVSQWDARGQAIGGWTLSPHHVYDFNAQTLYRGDGTRASAAALLGFTLSPTVIDTIAGTGVRGTGAPGLPASQTQLDTPFAVAVAPDGTVYIAEDSLQPGTAQIRRIAPDGTTQVVAGGGAFVVNGVPKTRSRVRAQNIAFGPDGDLCIADTGHHCVRRIDAAGIIYAVGGFAGDGGPATAARLSFPRSIAFTDDGTLYISDNGNRRIRQVTPDGIITTIAGTGVAGAVSDVG